MRKRFKKGAASFYIVAFSTLILVVIATSFAMVIASEIARTSNDDLSQSAYDSALAGVEDAKVAFSNYRRCMEAGQTEANPPIDNSSTIECSEIVWWMQHPDCYMVGHIVGKIPKAIEWDNTKDWEVTVGGVTINNGSDTRSSETTTNQAYTCVKITTDLSDYRTTLNAKKKIQTMRASAENGNTDAVDTIKISWFSNDNIQPIFTNFREDQYATSEPRAAVTFQSATDQPIAVPPTVELQIVQTANTFYLSDLDKTDVARGVTDRATLYLVPAGIVRGKEQDQNRIKNLVKIRDDNEAFYAKYNYIGVYNAERGVNSITAQQVAKTNDRSVKNKPFALFCDSADEFYCSVEIEVPRPVSNGDGDDSKRNDSTFMISFSLPYQQPDTDFSIELYCSGERCGSISSTPDEETNNDEPKQLKIANTQISIDSTGRANDLYRRVETRLETSDTTFKSGYPYYALQVLGNDAVTKEMKVSKEVGFYF